MAEEEETTAEDAIMATVVVEDKTMLPGLPEKKLKRIHQHPVESQEKAVMDQEADAGEEATDAVEVVVQVPTEHREIQTTLQLMQVGAVGGIADKFLTKLAKKHMERIGINLSLRSYPEPTHKVNSKVGPHNELAAEASKECKQEELMRTDHMVEAVVKGTLIVELNRIINAIHWTMSNKTKSTMNTVKLLEVTTQDKTAVIGVPSEVDTTTIKSAEVVVVATEATVTVAEVTLTVVRDKVVEVEQATRASNSMKTDSLD